MIDKKYLTSLLIIFTSLTSIFGCSIGEKYNVQEDQQKVIKTLVIFTPEAAKKIINDSFPEEVDLSSEQSKEIIEAHTKHMIKSSNYIIENSSISHKIELVDGDISDDFKSYILNKTEDELIQEAEDFIKWAASKQRKN